MNLPVGRFLTGIPLFSAQLLVSTVYPVQIKYNFNVHVVETKAGKERIENSSEQQRRRFRGYLAGRHTHDDDSD